MKIALPLLLLANVVVAQRFVAAVPLPPNYKYTEIHHLIIAELEGFPRPGPFKFQELPIKQWPEFDPTNLHAYDADYRSFEVLRKELEQNPGKHPLRAAVLDGLKILESAKFTARDTLSAQPLKPQGKLLILKEQQVLGSMVFELEKGLAQLARAGEERAKEPSRRWQAHYDHVQALFLARLIFCYEYNYMLAQLRTDRMPELPFGCPGWRLASRPTLQITEPRARSALKQLHRLLTKIETDHPGTPWAAVAEGELKCHRGLEWQPDMN